MVNLFGFARKNILARKNDIVCFKKRPRKNLEKSFHKIFLTQEIFFYFLTLK